MCVCVRARTGSRASQRVLLALVAALITVVAEGWLFVRYADTPTLGARLAAQETPARPASAARRIVSTTVIPGVITRASSASSMVSTDSGASIELRPLMGATAAGTGGSHQR